MQNKATQIIYFIVGAGGYGREVLPLARRQLENTLQSGDARLVFAVEGPIENDMANGASVLPLEEILALRGKRFFNIAIGNSQVRERIAKKCIEAGCAPFSIIADTAIVMDGCEIGPGAILSPMSIVTSNVKIGAFFHANLFAYVAHDCVVGDFVTLAPKAACNGNVHIGDHSYIGTGAIIREGSASAPLVVGERATVGMGSVVTRPVAAGITVVGNPAREMNRRE